MQRIELTHATLAYVEGAVALVDDNDNDNNNGDDVTSNGIERLMMACNARHTDEPAPLRIECSTAVLFDSARARYYRVDKVVLPSLSPLVCYCTSVSAKPLSNAANKEDGSACTLDEARRALPQLLLRPLVPLGLANARGELVLPGAFTPPSVQWLREHGGVQLSDDDGDDGDDVHACLRRHGCAHNALPASQTWTPHAPSVALHRFGVGLGADAYFALCQFVGSTLALRLTQRCTLDDVGELLCALHEQPARLWLDNVIDTERLALALHQSRAGSRWYETLCETLAARTSSGAASHWQQLPEALQAHAPTPWYTSVALLEQLRAYYTQQLERRCERLGVHELVECWRWELALLEALHVLELTTFGDDDNNVRVRLCRYTWQHEWLARVLHTFVDTQPALDAYEAFERAPLERSIIVGELVSRMLVTFTTMPLPGDQHDAQQMIDASLLPRYTCSLYEHAAIVTPSLLLADGDNRAELRRRVHSGVHEHCCVVLANLHLWTASELHAVLALVLYTTQQASDSAPVSLWLHACYDGGGTRRSGALAMLDSVLAAASACTVSERLHALAQSAALQRWCADAARPKQARCLGVERASACRALNEATVVCAPQMRYTLPHTLSDTQRTLVVAVHTQASDDEHALYALTTCGRNGNAAHNISFSGWELLDDTVRRLLCERASNIVVDAGARLDFDTLRTLIGCSQQPVMVLVDPAPPASTPLQLEPFSWTSALVAVQTR